MKFQCQESCGGKCCTYNPAERGFVFLTQADRIRLALFLAEPVPKFAEYAEFSATRFSPVPTRQWVLRGGRDACQFFKYGRCMVYEARPTQCRTFPYWPGHTEQELSARCPGIGHGDDSKQAQQYELQREADEELRKNRV